MDQIIVKKLDGGIIRIIPNHRIYGNEENKRPYSECKGLQSYIDQGFEWFICDHSNLPSKLEMESRKQWYHDGNVVKCDKDWIIRLMPDQLIKRKHIKRIQAKIDAELEKEAPDSVALIRLQRDCDKCGEIKAGPQNENKLWSEIALQNLDERVANGEPDKPLIRQKLMEKINAP